MQLAVHVSKMCSPSMLQPFQSVMLDCLYSLVTAYRGLIRKLRAGFDHSVQLPIKQNMMLQTVASMVTGRIRVKAGQTFYTLLVFLLLQVCQLCLFHQVPTRF